jgi:hypothetical protein
MDLTHSMPRTPLASEQQITIAKHLSRDFMLEVIKVGC